MCRRADIILAAALVLLSLLVFWLLPGQSGGTRTVTVLQDGKTIYEGPLAQNAVIELDGDYHNTVTIQGGVHAVLPGAGLRAHGRRFAGRTHGRLRAQPHGDCHCGQGGRKRGGFHCGLSRSLWRAYCARWLWRCPFSKTR